MLSLVSTRLMVCLFPLFPPDLTLLLKWLPLSSNTFREQQKPNQNCAMRQKYLRNAATRPGAMADGKRGNRNSALLARTPTDSHLRAHLGKWKMPGLHHSASPHPHPPRETLLYVYGRSERPPRRGWVRHHILGDFLALLLTRWTLSCASTTNSYLLRFCSF